MYTVYNHRFSLHLQHGRSVLSVFFRVFYPKVYKFTSLKYKLTKQLEMFHKTEAIYTVYMMDASSALDLPLKGSLSHTTVVCRSMSLYDETFKQNLLAPNRF